MNSHVQCTILQAQTSQLGSFPETETFRAKDCFSAAELFLRSPEPERISANVPVLSRPIITLFLPHPQPHPSTPPMRIVLFM